MPNLGTEFIPPTTGDTTQVLYGIGYLMTSALGTALPADIDLGDFTKWSSALPIPGWTYVGSTDQGVTMELNPSMNNIQIEEQPTPIASLMNTATFTITTSLAEETIDHINLAYGGAGTKTLTTASVGQPGKSVLKLSSLFPVIQCAIMARNNLGFPRIFYVPRVMSAGQVQTAFRRSADKRMYPLTLNALCDLSQIQITDITVTGS